MNVSEEITETIKKTIQEDSERTGQVVFRGLIDNAPVNRIPESLFVSQFLPLFAGTAVNPPENWTLIWVSVAGTAMSEVVVYDDNTNLELYKVPALLHTSGLVLHKTEGDIGDIFGRYNQITQNIPTSGLTFLLEALRAKNSEYMQAFDNSSVVGRWIEIFKRYGLLTEHTVGVNGETAQTSDDYFEF